MVKHFGCAAWAVCGLALIAAPAEAQSLLGQLSTLLVEQRASGEFVPDVAAAAATRDTVARLLAIELGTFPIASSSGGFIYRSRPDLGTYERVSFGFGPFFTERTLRNSRKQASLGLSYQVASFGSLQGGDLDDGSFPTNAARLSGAIDPFAVDTLRLELTTHTATPFLTYGVTDKFSMGVSVPIVTVKVDGLRFRTAQGVTTLQSNQSGTASGLGDIVLNGRYLVAGTGSRGFAVGADWRLPTGSEADLLGTADAAGRFLALGSWEEDRLSVHVNGGVGVGGVSRELSWSTATTLAVTPRLTLVGEVLGRRLSELNRVSDVYQPHPVLAGVETMRWLPSERGVHNVFVLVGTKWNVAGSWLLNTSVLMRVTDAGLRSAFTPAIAIDYAPERFGR